jgi:hypothetical protein
MRIFVIIIFFLSTPLFSFGQENSDSKKSNKGKIYAFWGWNRGWYTNSDIHFTGNDYDFKLNDIEATDRPSPFDFGVYFNIKTITIPQTNLRVGYFVSDKIDISVGVDHLKYVMVEIQETEITGTIEDGTEYDGHYSNDKISTKQSFLKFEHTDGLNYINAEITRNDNLLEALNMNVNTDKLEVSTLIGFGIGGILPKSNVTLWNNDRHDDFHWAGYGFSGKVGLNTTFFKHFFLRSEYKVGFIDMPDIRTTADPSDKASQHFIFRELNIIVGLAFNPFH